MKYFPNSIRRASALPRNRLAWNRAAAAAVAQNKGIVHITKEYIRHEVFLNSIFAGGSRAGPALYVQKFRKLMRRLP